MKEILQWIRKHKKLTMMLIVLIVFLPIIVIHTPVYNFFNKKMPHKAFCCIMNLTKTLQRIVTLYDKLIIQ